MRLEDIKVGDVLRTKSWAELANKYGETNKGDIEFDDSRGVPITANKEDKCLYGVYGYVVLRVHSADEEFPITLTLPDSGKSTTWNFSPDELEPDNPPTPISEEDFLSLFD